MANPLVPDDVDLRDFAFMPLDVQRLLTSETWMLGSGDERAAAMTLWLVSWHQVPAGSLPDNERMLERMSDCRGWKKAKAHALRGWVPGGDGRLYHPVVCEKALEAWLEKLAQRLSSGAGNAKRWGIEFDTAPVEARMQEARTLLTALNPDSRTLAKRRTSGIPAGSKPAAVGTPIGIPPGSQETGTETGTGNKDQGLPPDGGGKAGKPTSPPADLAAAQQERLKQVTEDAIAAYNAALAKPVGLLPAVLLLTEERKRHVKRCLSVARAICQREYGSDRITAEFWVDYFAAAAADDFHSGRTPGGKGHENWTPDFEFLTQPDIVQRLFERAKSAGDAAGVA